MKTSKITHVELASPPTWANPKDGTVFNRYAVNFANGERYTFLARGQFRKAVGEDAQYQVKNEDMKTAKLMTEMNKQQFKPQVYNKSNTGGKNDETQTLIIRQSSMSSACNFYQQRDATEEEVINYARKIEQYVTNG